MRVIYKGFEDCIRGRYSSDNLDWYRIRKIKKALFWKYSIFGKQIQSFLYFQSVSVLIQYWWPFYFWQIFRDNDEIIISKQRLSLQLCDFASKTCFVNITQQMKNIIIVQIIYKQFFSFLYNIETKRNIKQTQRCIQFGLSTNNRKRYRQIISLEVLNQGKEAKYIKYKTKEAARFETKNSI